MMMMMMFLSSFSAVFQSYQDDGRVTFERLCAIKTIFVGKNLSSSRIQTLYPVILSHKADTSHHI